jgi:hypothetical protein
MNGNLFGYDCYEVLLRHLNGDIIAIEGLGVMTAGVI